MIFNGRNSSIQNFHGFNGFNGFYLFLPIKKKEEKIHKDWNKTSVS